jgi:4-carboxymuconolactone decarboxylase
MQVAAHALPPNGTGSSPNTAKSMAPAANKIEETPMKTMLASIGLVLAFAGIAHAADRLPTVAPENYTAEQKNAAAEFLAARKVPVFGPFEPLMHSPQVMNQARAMGDYLRYNSAIGNTLSELAILVSAREWSQDYEWYVHYPIALKAGIKKDVADAIGDGRRPVGMTEDEEIVYDFSTELHRNRRVSDRTFDRADKRFGKKGVVDLTGINAYYTLLAMQMNVAQYRIPKDGKKLDRFPD